MSGDDACLLDSKILLRISRSDDPQHAAISLAFRAPVGQGVRLCYTSLMLGECGPRQFDRLDRNIRRAARQPRMTKASSIRT